MALLERNRLANDKILTKFSEQFASMEEPPSEFGLYDAYRHLKEEIRVLESETLTSGPDASPTSAPSTHTSTNIQPDDLVAEPCSEPQDSTQPQPKASYLKNIPEAPDSNAATEPQPKVSRLLALKRLILRFIADAQVRGKRLFRLKA
ncbi:hypothetical protein BJ165DRAFT_1530360 [Panaeolus papilionaceus]|nr:hypothetical protein BJ165DRAFT_1530360 [Panaeolus papilionaceus]